MGGFPALMINNQQPSPIAELAQVQQIKSGQLEQQAEALKIQLQQQQIKDAHALTQAYATYAQLGPGANPNQIGTIFSAMGGSGPARQALEQHLLAMRQTASETAKNDAITAQDTADTAIKLNDQRRGKLLNIAQMADPAAKQTAWQQELASERAAGTNIPQGISDQYPGDNAVKTFANSLATGSQMVKEEQERQKLALDAWKSSGGQLVNAISGERIGGIDPSQVPFLNQALKTRYQNLHPGEDVPDFFQLKPGASPNDFDRVDKLLEATEKAHFASLTHEDAQAQRAVANATRAATLEMMRDKADMNPVVGLDKDGRQVLLPMSQAQQLGVQNPMKADADMVNKALAARHWLNLANKQGDPKGDPDKMGILQLVDKLDEEGKLGPIASRWNEFLAGKYGSGDAGIAALRAKMGLSTTLLMQAHVGSRGSAQMLEHFEDLANQKKLDGPTLKAALGAEVNYVQDKAMDPNPPSYGKPVAAKQAEKFQVPAGAPAAPKEDGHTLRMSGKDIAVSKGGQWVAP